MPELNKANRQVCDVDIRFLKTGKPFLFFDTANTTTVGLSGDSTYAMAKGYRRVAFQNPTEGTLTIEAQVVPFKFYAMLASGVIETEAAYAEHVEVAATEAGKLDIADNGIEAGSIYVYAAGEYGGEEIEGVYADGVFTATTEGDIAIGESYEVGYIVAKNTGVKKVSFTETTLTQDYYITMSTVDKDEEGGLTPFIITAYKASVQRDFEMAFSSEDDPVSYSITFDLLSDKRGRILDFVEDSNV